LAICKAIQALQNEGLSPTRGENTNCISGCDILVKVLGEINVASLNFDQVKDIWEKRNFVHVDISKG
jgi:hypothetical protein